MNHSISLVIGAFLFLSVPFECKADCPAVSPTAGNVTRIRQKLLCNYDRNTIPVTTGLSTGAFVMILLQVNSLEMESYRENLRLNGILRFGWQDDRLSWISADYGNMNFVKFSGQEIWSPDITLNLLTESGVRELRTGDCLVHYSGQILCSPNVKLLIPCTQNMRHFPFDEHNCTFTLSSMLHFEHQINISHVATDFINLKRHRGFEVVKSQVYLHKFNVSQFHTQETYYPVQVLSIYVRRHAAAAAASLILPAFGLMILTLITFWMDTLMNARITLCGFVSMGYISYLVLINYVIPSNGETIPVIVTILRDGFLLTIFAGVIAVVVGNMAASTGSPPRWLTRITDWVELGFLGRLLLPSSSTPLSAGDEEATILDGPSKIHPWTTFTQILDRLSFYLSLATMAILFMGYIP